MLRLYTDKIVLLTRFLGNKTVWLFLLGILSGVLLGFSELALALLLHSLFSFLGLISQQHLPQWLDFAAEIPPHDAFIFLFLIVILRGTLSFMVAQSATVSHELLLTRLKQLLVLRMLQHNERPVSSAEANFHIAEIFPKAGHFCQNFSFAVSSLIQSAVLLFGLLVVGLWESALAILGLAVIYFLSIQINKVIHKRAAQISQQHKFFSEGIERVSRNFLFLKAHGILGIELDKLSQNLDDYWNRSYHTKTLVSFAGSLPIFLGGILLIFITVVGVYYFETDGVLLLTFLYLFIRLTQNLSTSSKHVSQCSSYLPGLMSAFKFFSDTPYLLSENSLSLRRKDSRSSNKKQHTHRTKLVLPPSILMKDVSFDYRAGEKPLFSRFNLSVEPGHSLGIMGRSGSGKSTLLALVLGVVEPDEGEVLINNSPPKEFLEKHPGAVGYVGPTPYLIAGSLRENLLYGLTKHVTDAACLEALAKVGMFEHLKSLKAGLDYQLNENADELSSGQKQRLSLARALVHDPLLLILDEPSANLDVATEQHISKLAKSLRREKTLIITSHREVMIEFADNRILLGGVNG